jgi:hypothetical protein
MILVTTKTANVEQLNLPWRVFAFQHPHLSVSFSAGLIIFLTEYFSLNYKAPYRYINNPFLQSIVAKTFGNCDSS